MIPTIMYPPAAVSTRRQLGFWPATVNIVQPYSILIVPEGWAIDGIAGAIAQAVTYNSSLFVIPSAVADGTPFFIVVNLYPALAGNGSTQQAY